MRIVTSKQMKQIEQNSIQYQMSYLRLMENAGCAAARFILETLRAVSGLNCVVFCGKGNNGGDGFVVARKLSEQGANVTVVLADGEPKTPDAIQMLSLVRTMQLPVFSFEDEPEAVSAAMDEVDVIVDAIYGQRISRGDRHSPPPDHPDDQRGHRRRLFAGHPQRHQLRHRRGRPGRRQRRLHHRL